MAAGCSAWQGPPLFGLTRRFTSSCAGTPWPDGRRQRHAVEIAVVA